MIKQSSHQRLPSIFASPSIGEFLLRNNLPVKTLQLCQDFMISCYPGDQIKPVSSQGFCSLTFIIGTEAVIQFRPPAYALDLNITSLASTTYPLYAPSTKYLGKLEDEGGGGLLVYEMTLTPGISLQSLRLKDPTKAQDPILLARLVKDFADFQIASHHTSKISPAVPPAKLGPVGSSLPTRLQALHTYLPPRFRPKTHLLLDNFQNITERLPWILTHGDLLPGNVLLSPTTGQLTGLVDWTESEILPFGMSFYGLEEILGRLQVPLDESMEREGEKEGEFVYHSQASDLRSIFWNTLEEGIPELKEDDGKLRKKVNLARDLGVFLWFGIAFDGGAINRVVSEGSDGDREEIVKLDAFLGLEKDPEQNNMKKSESLSVVRKVVLLEVESKL